MSSQSDSPVSRKGDDSHINQVGIIKSTIEMMKVSTLLLSLVSVASQASAFSLPAPTMRAPTQLASTNAPTRSDFYKAVEAAASTNSIVHSGELERMASELENVDGCSFEDGEELCDKEIQDRLDVAGVLRLKIELQLR